MNQMHETALRLLGPQDLLGHHHGAVVRECLRQHGLSTHARAAQLPSPPAVRDLVLDREPFVDVSSLDASRFAADQARPELNCV